MSSIRTPAVASSVPRLAVTRDEAAEAIGVSARTIDSLIADRTRGFPVVRIGTRVVIPVRELSEWLSRQLPEGGATWQSN